MVNVTITKTSLDALLNEVKLRVDGVTSIITPYNREQVAKAAFTIIGKEFVRQTNRYASANKSSMHHVYEWNKSGNNSSRLFRLNRDYVQDGKLIISTKLLDSRTSVPVSPQLRKVGKNGKSVKGGHIFKNKASVMEAGKPITIQAKGAKALAFPGRNGIVFIPKGRSVTVRNPGGKAVGGSFTRHTKEWFKNPVNTTGSLLSSGYLKKLEIEIAKCLSVNKSGRMNVATTIKKVSDQYSKGIKVI